MDSFNEEIYGKVLWECYRSKVYIVTLSLMYVLLGAAAVIWAMNENQFLFYVLAVVVIFFCLWRINRVHHPVALICERKLLVAVPWSFFTFDYYITFRALYMPVAYKDVAGVSTDGIICISAAEKRADLSLFLYSSLMFPEMASMISRTGSKANSVNKKKSRPSGSFLLIFLTSDTDVQSVFLTVFLILCVSSCNARLIMLP